MDSNDVRQSKHEHVINVNRTEVNTLVHVQSK